MVDDHDALLARALEDTDPRSPHLYVIDDELDDKLEAVADLAYNEIDVHTLALEALSALRAGEDAAQHLAAALRESQANYHAALDIIAHLTQGYDAIADPHGSVWYRSPILADEGESLTAPMSDRQWAVYTHAAQRATGTHT